MNRVRHKVIYSALAMLITLVMLTTVLLVSCAKPTPTPPTTPVSTLKIGSTQCFAMRQGIQLKRILELQVERINDAGGIVVGGKKYNIELIVYDDNYEADKARAAAERLVHIDKVQFIIGTISSASVLAIAEVTEPAKIPVIHGATASQLLGPGYKYLFHAYPTEGTVSAQITYYKERFLNPAWQKVVLISNDDVTGKAMSALYGAQWLRNGYNILNKLFFARGQTDFGLIAAEVLALKPDIVHFAGVLPGKEIFGLVKALYEFGYRGQLIDELAAASLPEIAEKVGKEALLGGNGFICDFGDVTETPNPPKSMLEFREAYVKKYGVWETDGILFSAPWWVTMEALKRADSLDPDAFMTALEGLEVIYPRGRLTAIRRPDLKNDRYVDSVGDSNYGQVNKAGKLEFAGTLTMEFAIENFERIKGMSLR